MLSENTECAALSIAYKKKAYRDSALKAVMLILTNMKWCKCKTQTLLMHFE